MLDVSEKYINSAVLLCDKKKKIVHTKLHPTEPQTLPESRKFGENVVNYQFYIL